MTVYCATTSGSQSTNSTSMTPINGLSITIPEGVGENALVILNLPLAYAQGNNNPGITVGITVNGVQQSIVGGFTYNEQVPPSTGRIPITLVVPVPLSGSGAQTIVGVWSGVRGGTALIDSPSTLTAIL